MLKQIIFDFIMFLDVCCEFGQCFGLVDQVINVLLFGDYDFDIEFFQGEVMEYIVDYFGDMFCVKIFGVLIFDDYECFKLIVNFIVKGEESEIILDLGQIKMIDFVGIGMLFLVNDKVVKEFKKLNLMGVIGYVVKVIELFKVDQIILIL